MRKISTSKIRTAVKALCLKANTELRQDVVRALQRALRKEKGRPKRIIRAILENAKIAKRDKLAICQDTGMVEVFLEIGRGVKLTGKDLKKNVNEGVKDAYQKGYFRKSIVKDPLLRKNTKTNTPAVISTEIAEGERVKIAVMPKGFGSENKSALKMLLPTADIKDVEGFVIEVVKAAGPSACPPFVVGVGMGGTMDKAALLSKEALLRPIDKKNPKPHLQKLERRLLEKINKTRIGALGFGGATTALGVNVSSYATHIAGMPVAVTISCHATRGASTTL